MVTVISRSLSSGSILRDSKANKVGLSYALDGTMRRGAHDMKTFGLGTAASLATVERYARFTAAMHHVYGTMERSFDASSSPVVVPLWQRFGDSLRRAETGPPSPWSIWAARALLRVHSKAPGVLEVLAPTSGQTPRPLRYFN